MKPLDREILFNEMYQENKGRVYRLCYGYLSDRCEIDDLFQEIMIHIWSNLDKFRHQSKLSTWVYRIAVNTALLYNKRLKKKGIVDSTDKMNGHGDPSAKKGEDLLNQMEHEENLSRLHQAVLSLKKQDRLIMTLVLEDLSYEEISEIVGISVNYVGVKITRLKEVLAKRFKGENHE